MQKVEGAVRQRYGDTATIRGNADVKAIIDDKRSSIRGLQEKGLEAARP